MKLSLDVFPATFARSMPSGAHAGIGLALRKAERVRRARAIRKLFRASKRGK
jgi:hypothetical protein